MEVKEDMGEAYADGFVFGACCEELAVWAEAEGSDVEITDRVRRLVIQDTVLSSDSDFRTMKCHTRRAGKSSCRRSAQRDCSPSQATCHQQRSARSRRHYGQFSSTTMCSPYKADSHLS